MAWPPRPTCEHRDRALAAGAKTYENGKPCKHGHLGPRYTRNRGCVVCCDDLVRRWAQDNREAVREKSRRHRENNLEKELKRCAKWRAENAERHREMCLKWRRENPEKARAATARWVRENPHKVSANHGKRRAAMHAAEGHHTADDITRITAAQGGKCACCRERRKLTLDHITPLAKGGSNWPANLQMLCKSCNSAKGARDQIEFMQTKGRLL
jgi:5-methylcytosine-specific restriction endonuclease McrA